ncbi:YybH family protein [Geodermatophilus sp. SYSU D00742]
MTENEVHAVATEEVAAVVRAHALQLEAAFRRGDAAAVGACFAADAVLVPPDRPPVCGRRAITGFWAQVMGRPGAAMSLVVDRVDVVGNLATATGRNLRSGRPEDASDFVAVWRRTAGGWALVSDVWEPASRGWQAGGDARDGGQRGRSAEGLSAVGRCSTA